MNILEQIPKSSPSNTTNATTKSSLTESYKDIPALFDFSSKEIAKPAVRVNSLPVISLKNISLKDTSLKDTSLKDTSLSDTLLKYDFRSLVIVVLLVIILLAYFGFNILNMFGNALQNILDILSPLTAGIINFIRNSTGNAINTVADVTADISRGGIDLAEGAVENVGNIIIGDEAVQRENSQYNDSEVEEGEGKEEEGKEEEGKEEEGKEEEKEGFMMRTTHNKIHDEHEPAYASQTSSKLRLCGVPLIESDKCISGKTFANRH